MAYQFYVYIVGQKSGQVKGSVTEKGREESIGGLAVSHSVGFSIDSATGIASDKFHTQPVKFTKAWDSSTPVLLNLLATRENLSSVEIRFWEPVVTKSTGVATEQQNMTLRMKNATIVTISQYTASPDQLNQFDAGALEDITLVYQELTVTDNKGGLTASIEGTNR